MQSKVLLWIFTVLILIIILAGASLSFGLVFAAICIALIVDLYAVRFLLIEMRIRLARQGLELGQVIPSTLVIFGWLIYAVVHFQIFLSIVHFLDLPAEALKWVFPLTALKALWPAYYLGSNLPVEKQNNFSTNKIAFQIPWAIGGAYLWWVGNVKDVYNPYNIAWAIIIIIITFSPGFLYCRTIRI